MSFVLADGRNHNGFYYARNGRAPRSEWGNCRALPALSGSARRHVARRDQVAVDAELAILIPKTGALLLERLRETPG
jgi:hypothetical protein